MKRWISVILIVLGLGAVVTIAGIYQIHIDALREPGHIETILATRAKHILVLWSSSRDSISLAPTDLQASIEEGDKLYGIECAMCHGADGHTPTDPVGGCIRASPISHHPRCNNIPIANCSG